MGRYVDNRNLSNDAIQIFSVSSDNLVQLTIVAAYGSISKAEKRQD